MQNWKEDNLSAFRDITSEHELFDKARAIAATLGFDYCAYGMQLPLSIAQPKLIMLNNYDAGWQQAYMDNNYLLKDPTVRHCQKSLDPLSYSDKVFKDAPDLWEDAQSFGLKVGLVQSCRNAQGVAGMITLARSHDQMDILEQRAHEEKLYWLAQSMHLGISRIVYERETPEAATQLSQRETEVLRWTAEGKTSFEISLILNISERTVNFHIANTMQKLNATNKIAATIRALVLGLL